MIKKLESRERRWIALIFSLGVFLRADLYIANPALWTDEAWRWLGIKTHSLLQLLLMSPVVPNAPTPPRGFLLVEKLLVGGGGGRYEYVLRAFPFIVGLAALVACIQWLRKMTDGRTAATAFALFAFSKEAIIQSTQLKEHITGVLAAAGLYLAVAWRDENPADHRRDDLLAFGGVSALFFAHKALFVLPGILVPSLVSRWHDVEERRRWIRVSMYWMLAFEWLYFTTYHPMRMQQTVTGDVTAWLWPRPLWSVAAWGWLGRSLMEIVKSPMGLPPFLGAGLTCLGAVRIYCRDPIWFWRLILPFLMTLAAAAVHVYPFHGRYLIFLLPAFYFFVAEGIAGMTHSGIGRIQRSIGIVLGVSVIFVQAVETFPVLQERKEREEIRSAMRYIQSEAGSGDIVFVNEMGSYAYRYYLGRFPGEVTHKDFLVFSDNFYKDIDGREFFLFFLMKPRFDRAGDYDGIAKERTVQQVIFRSQKSAHLPQHRVTWVLFSHYRTRERSGSYPRFLAYLRGRGNLVVKERGVRLFRFELNENSFGGT